MCVDRWKGTALMMLSATGFGVMVLFSRTAMQEGVDTASLMFMRLGMAAVALMGLAWRRRVVWPSGRATWVAVAMGAVFSGNALAYFMALNEGAAASVAAVFYCYPVIVALIGCVISRKLMDARTTWCMALAVGGCWLTVVPSHGHELALPRAALHLALASALMYAIYVLMSRALHPGSDPLAQAGIITGSAALCLGLVVAAQGLSHPVSWLGWACVLGMALLSTVVSITAFLAGARILGTNRAAALSAAEPVVTAITAWVAFGEALSLQAWAGLMLVVGAVVLSTRGDAAKAQVAAS